MPDPQIIRKLPPLRWRGLDAPPYDLVTFEFQNELSPRSVPYVDGEVHDNTGRKSYPMTARLFFVNTLDTTRELFPALWNEWRARLDGEAGDLQHPVLGQLRARVQNAKGEIRSSTQAGVIVDISWIETNEDPGTLFTIAGIPQSDPATLAAAADVAAAAFGVRYYPPDQTQTLLTAWGAAREGLFSPTASALGELQKLTGAVVRMIGEIEKIYDAVASAISALDLLLSFWEALRAQEATLARAVRPTARKVTPVDTTLDAFAASVGNTLLEVMGLNPHALRAPFVPRGTTLRYYVGAPIFFT